MIDAICEECGALFVSSVWIRDMNIYSAARLKDIPRKICPYCKKGLDLME